MPSKIPDVAQRRLGLVPVKGCDQRSIVEREMRKLSVEPQALCQLRAERGPDAGPKCLQVVFVANFQIGERLLPMGVVAERDLKKFLQA